MLVFIVPRQIVSLGDLSKRSCDACESLGASVKRIIRHATCRRRASATTLHKHTNSKGKSWSATFTRGYIEQAFRRVCVRADLIHGVENERYLQRADERLRSKGKVARDTGRARAPKPYTVAEAMCVPTVWSEEAALAVWS